MLWVWMTACVATEGPVGLNEIGGDQMDDQGESSGWAEVYNSTDSTVSLEGWSLDYDGAIWVLDAIDVPADDLVVLWLDGEPEQGMLHADFALDASGGNLQVFDDSGTLIQDISVPELDVGASYGRKPDGAANWQVISDPSPGALNAP